MQSTTANSDTVFPTRVQRGYEPKLVFSLLAPLVLWVALERGAFNILAYHGLYFFGAAIAFLYSYFCLARFIYIFNNGRNSDGQLSAQQMRIALQSFRYVVTPQLLHYKRFGMWVVGAAIVMDVLLSPMGYLHFTAAYGIVLLAKALTWLRLGPGFVEAVARCSDTRPFNWSPSWSQDTTEQRKHSSFHVHVFFPLLLVYLVMSSPYLPLRIYLFGEDASRFVSFWFSVFYYSFFAAFALYLQCLWSVWCVKKLNNAVPLQAARQVERPIIFLRIVAVGSWMLVVVSSFVLLAVTTVYVSSKLLAVDATVLKSEPICRYRWTWDKRKREVQFGACGSKPVPRKAPRDSKVTQQNFARLTLEARHRSGELVRGELFVPEHVGRVAVNSGTYRVLFRTGPPRSLRHVPSRRFLGVGFASLVMALLFWSLARSSQSQIRESRSRNKRR